MNGLIRLGGLILIFAVFVSAQTGEFTYQGRLVAGGSTANTPHDFEFRLCAAEDNCTPPLEIKHVIGVSVSNGVFTVRLDFGGEHFNGADRWLEIAVRPAGGSTFTTLTPRQRVTSAPYSIKSLNSETAIIATNATQLGGVAAGQYVITTDSRMTDARSPLPGSASYIQNSQVTSGPQDSSFNISGSGMIGGTMSGNILNATTQFNLNGSRVMGNGGNSTNLFVGINAAPQNTTGSQNSFFGRSIALNNTTGTGNSFFGLNAGINNTSGNFNSFFGRGAGSDNVSGSFNTMLGSGATVGAGDLSYATAIGAGSIADTSNTVVLGRSTDSVQVPGTLSGNGSGLTGVPGTVKWEIVSGLAQQAQPNKGYIVNGAETVTITLPTTPAVGDIIRVSAIGTGGWKIAQNDGQSIIGTNLGLIGINWTPRESDRGWWALASSADGAKLIAGDSPGRLYTSPDSGVTWTQRHIEGFWVGLASSADGSKLVAADANGQLHTSTDSGVSWLPRASTRQWWSVASSADGSKLAAVVNGGQIWTSANSGVSWEPRESAREWYGIASSADGSKLVATVSDGKIYTSTDSGANWTEREIDRAWALVASSADGTKLIAAVSGGRLYTSTDSGVSWMPRESDRFWWAVASSADGTKLVAGDEVGRIYTSGDSGQTWIPRESNRDWQSVASSADGSKIIAGAEGGRLYTSSAITTLGPAGYLTGGQSSAIELLYIGSSQFQPLSVLGTIAGN